MRVLLVDYFQYSSAVAQSPVMPMGLLSLAEVLKADGHQPQIISFNELFQTGEITVSKEPERDFAAMVRYLLAKKPDVVGFATVCSSFHNALLLSRYIKELAGNVKVMMGGPHASALPERILTAFPWIDLICVGEAEGSIAGIINGLATGRLDDACGVVYRRGDIVVRNKEAALIEDLDTLPQPDYTRIPYFHKLKEITIETGRGCPYGCIYCSTSAYWQRRFRTKSAERICAEINAGIKMYPGQKPVFSFIHDNFTTNYDFTVKLCEQLKKLDITWTCNARIDTLDEPLIRIMAEAGCRGILIGLETGSPRMQKCLHKNLDLARLDFVTDTMIHYNIQPIASFIFGFPGETEEDLGLTLAVMQSLLKKGVPTKFFALCVLAGTKIFEDNQEQLVLRNYFSNVNQFANNGLPRELVVENREIFSHYYTLNGSLADRHFLLDKFINFIVINFYYLFPETFAMLLAVFQGSLFALYQDFLTVQGKQMEECFMTTEAAKGAPMAEGFWKYMLTLLTDYVHEKAWQDPRFKMIAHRLGTEKTWLARYFKQSGVRS